LRKCVKKYFLGQMGVPVTKIRFAPARLASDIRQRRRIAARLAKTIKLPVQGCRVDAGSWAA
jgi:hypothetical protein